MIKPVAVLISDIHFSLKTMNLASKALTAAIQKADALQVPVIVAGDVNDSKAILRAEYVSEIINCVKNAKVPIKVLIGNHDRWNEKDPRHSLEFLHPYVDLIDSTRIIDQHFGNFIGFIPYQSSNEVFLKELNQFRPSQIIVCHQGFMGAAMGEYVKDSSSVDPKLVSNYRIISGHYHMRQTIGTVTYIGTPYTITFSEAKDGDKGIQILYNDGSLEFLPLGLRRHVIIERTTDNLTDKILELINKDDLVWLKVSGPKIELDKINKRQLGKKLLGIENFKLDLIPDDVQQPKLDITNMEKDKILDLLIDQDETVCYDNKTALKQLWRELLK